MFLDGSADAKLVTFYGDDEDDQKSYSNFVTRGLITGHGANNLQSKSTLTRGFHAMACHLRTPWRHDMPTQTVRDPKLPPVCPKCESHRTRIVGQSGNPPLIHRRCEACEHVFFRPLGDPSPPDLAA